MEFSAEDRADVKFYGIRAVSTEARVPEKDRARFLRGKALDAAGCFA